MSDLSSIVYSIHSAMRKGTIGPGEMADLRRLDPQNPDRLAFWQVIVRWVEGEFPLSDEQTQRWAAVLQGWAVLGPDLHHPKCPLGRAMEGAGMAESRLSRLLRAPDSQFPEAAVRLCRFMRAKREPFNWTEFARWVLADNRDQANDRIAQDYYRAKIAKERRGKA
ncbi:MAG: type I-E CRISPR-associated protein Cse2/CasB [Dehalococcoidia bacterium]|nr:type I-E CRISPR-associated protein Cse2/CasB [Dehalococcoidia bacterium]